LWTQIVAVFVMDAGGAEGREAVSTAVVVDSRSVKTTEAGAPRGFDAGKEVKGRKRHLAVDTLGLPIECQITAASNAGSRRSRAIAQGDPAQEPLGDIILRRPGVIGAMRRNARRSKARRIAIAVVKGPTKRSRDLSYCPSAGWRSERSVGSAERDACPWTSKRQLNRRSHGCNGARVPHRAEIGEGENRPRLNFESDSQKQLDAAKQSQSQYTNLLGSVSGAGHERFQSGVPFVSVPFPGQTASQLGAKP
jgi:DDE family transposase